MDKISAELGGDPLLQSLPGHQDGSVMLGGVWLRRKVGEGATGSIYAGFHSRLKIPAAVKVLKHTTPSTVSAFFAEARLTVAIEHPNLIRVYDLNIDPTTGLAYIVMEYVDGCTAYELLRRNVQTLGRALSPGSALEIILSAARAVGAAHARGIVHRDLKPDNILVRRDGAVKVTDLGLAEVRGERPDKRRASIVGTLGFISPECVAGHPPTPAADVFSLGAALFELLTGQLPFHVAHGDLLQYVPGASPDPCELNPAVGPGLSRVVRQCLRAKPQERYPDGNALAVALENTAELPVLSTRRAAFPAAVVMVVDDEPGALEMLARVLESGGFQPLCFSRPHEAISALRQARPALAIVDLNMPEMNGIALTRALRAVPGQPDLPVLMLSADGQPASIGAASQNGIDDYLVKPASLQELLLRVQLLARWGQAQQQRRELESALQGARKSSALPRAAALGGAAAVLAPSGISAAKV